MWLYYYYVLNIFNFTSYKTNVNIIAIAQTETKIKGYDMRILFNINLEAPCSSGADKLIITRLEHVKTPG